MFTSSYHVFQAGFIWRGPALVLIYRIGVDESDPERLQLQTACMAMA
jgi:hypothetical protein